MEDGAVLVLARCVDGTATAVSGEPVTQALGCLRRNIPPGTLGVVPPCDAAAHCLLLLGAAVSCPLAKPPQLPTPGPREAALQPSHRQTPSIPEPRPRCCEITSHGGPLLLLPHNLLAQVRAPAAAAGDQLPSSASGMTASMANVVMQRQAGADWYGPDPTRRQLWRSDSRLLTIYSFIEYALNAVNQGITALGIKGTMMMASSGCPAADDTTRPRPGPGHHHRHSRSPAFVLQFADLCVP